ncbi:hypothetical protein EMCRGX_G010739 [Ephydatia muelleri]
MKERSSDKKGYASDNKKINPWRHSLFEPSASVQGTYKCELNKDLHNNNSLLGQLNDAFNKVNPCLAKKVLTRTASEAVAKICTNALVSKALSLRRIHAGLIMKGVHSINALSFSHSNVESWESYHTVGSEPYFYDSSYTPVKHIQAIPVDQHGRCVVSKEIGTSNLMSMRPIKWQCASECRQPSKEEIEVIGTTKSLFKMSLDEIHQGLNKIDRGCTLVQQAQAIIPDTPDNGKQPRVSELHGHPISCEMLSCACPLRAIRASSTHYPILRTFLWLVYSVRKSHLAVAHIDKALSSGNVEEVVHTLGFSDLSLVFSEDGSDNAVFVKDHSVPGLGSIEHHLLISNADLIAEVQARWKDDPEFPCCSCERLHQRKQVSSVNFTHDKYHTDIWMQLRAYLDEHTLDQNYLYKNLYTLFMCMVTILKLLHLDQLPQ